MVRRDKTTRNYSSLMRIRLPTTTKSSRTSEVSRVHRSFPSEAGQPMPRTEIRFDEAHLSITRNEILRQLAEGEPSIDIASVGANGVLINGQTLMPGEVKIIATKTKADRFKPAQVLRFLIVPTASNEMEGFLQTLKSNAKKVFFRTYGEDRWSFNSPDRTGRNN